MTLLRGFLRGLCRRRDAERYGANTDRLGVRALREAVGPVMKRLEVALVVLAAIALYDRRVTRMVNECGDYTTWVADRLPAGGPQ